MFRPSILNRFLLRRFFSGVGLVLLVVCGIILAVTFVERLPSNATAMGALFDSWIRLLEYMPMFLPMSVFMGTLLTSYKLTKSSEGIIISGAGMSPFQSTKPFFAGAFLIGLLATTVVNPYSVSLSTKNISSDKLQLVDNKIWLRENTDNQFITMHAQDIEKQDNALIFKDSTIYVQGANFKLKMRIDADNVKLSDNNISAQDATIWYADGTTGATALEQLGTTGQMQWSAMDAFLGFIPGSFGETSTLCILIGAAILLYTGVASWRTMLSVFVGGLAMGYLFQAVGLTEYPAYYHLVVGGFAFGAVFMATDPVTSAQTNTGKYIVGFMTGALAVLVRVVNPAYPEGMMLAILFMNALAPTVDYFVVEANINRRKNRVKTVK